jgi:lysophospholipase L1-like esterase
MLVGLARRPRALAAMAAMASAALTILLISEPASAQTAVRYVALGDSYSAGVGAGSYFSSSGSCERSANAYPQLWDKANAPSSYASVACSNATTSTVISSQLSALGKSTTLVSMTIGGNDVGFRSVMETCVLESTSSCVSAIDTAESEMTSQLPGQLNSLLADIAARAPNARVVLLDYPQPYDLSKSAGCIGLSTTDRTDLNTAANDLDAQIKAAAARHGDVFADVRKAFAGHQICDASSWLHSLNFLHIGESYHPTAAGQAYGYEPVFTAAAG